MDRDVAIQLEDLLSQQLTLQEQVTDVTRKMREAITNRKIEMISKLITDQDQITERIDILERERLSVLRNLDICTGQAPKLIQILPHLPEENRNRLNSIRTSLKKRILENSRLNNDNAILLQESLVNIRKNVELIVQKNARPSGYAVTGKEKEKSSRNLLNRIA